eukprot:4480111-Alexandrium_andersonii.AAC.1
MSASLVGSEMCIRDRRSEIRRTPRTGVLGSSGRPAYLRAPRPGGQETVSYTHLTLPTICSV